MPKQLNNGQVSLSLQKAFNFKGRYQPMLDEVIVPVYQIEDPVPSLVQNTYAGSIQIAEGAVGDFARIRLTNPAGSGIVLTVTGASLE